MQDFETLKRSIDSTRDLESVVRTMKTLAAVSIRQYEQAVDSLEDFAETVDRGLAMVLKNVPPQTSLSELQGTGSTGIIVFGSDQGMCGQFNEQIGSFALDYFAEDSQPATEHAWMVIGSRISGKLLDAGCQIDYEFNLPGAVTGISPLVADILAEIDRWRFERHLGKIHIFYNQRISASSYKPHAQQLLPIDSAQLAESQTSATTSRSLPLFTMPPGVLLSRLIRQYLFVSLFRACAESQAGENASRIASMQAAEHNIKERLMNLQAEFNQRRQTAITEELLDVVTGFEALKEEK